MNANNINTSLQNHNPASSLQQRVQRAVDNGAMSPKIQFGQRYSISEFREKIQRKFRWSYCDIVNDSPNPITEPSSNHHKILLNLFDDDDILWIADTEECSGRPEHKLYFQSAGLWKARVVAPGALICSNPFKAGVDSRCNDNLILKKYWVVRSNTLKNDEIGAIFKWMISKNYKLRAVVEGASGLSGWFDYPAEEKILSLKQSLFGLMCDKSMFAASHPCEFPGAFYHGMQSRLIYFDPK
jgi:hypothetical protein